MFWVFSSGHCLIVWLFLVVILVAWWSASDRLVISGGHAWWSGGLFCLVLFVKNLKPFLQPSPSTICRGLNRKSQTRLCNTNKVSFCYRLFITSLFAAEFATHGYHEHYE